MVTSTFGLFVTVCAYPHVGLPTNKNAASKAEDPIFTNRLVVGDRVYNKFLHLANHDGETEYFHCTDGSDAD